MKYLLYVIIISYKMAETNIHDELQDNAICNINRVKTLCGNDKIHTRKLYESVQTLNSKDLIEYNTRLRKKLSIYIYVPNLVDIILSYEFRPKYKTLFVCNYVPICRTRIQLKIKFDD